MWQQFSQMVDWMLKLNLISQKSFIIIPRTRTFRSLIESGCGHSWERSKFKRIAKIMSDLIWI